MTVVSREVVKGLLQGQRPEPEHLGNIAVALAEALGQVQADLATAVARMEAKLDRSLRQDFHRSYGLGLYQLRDAGSQAGSDRLAEASISAARHSFMEAAAGTEDRVQRIQALHALAACSLAVGRPDAARRELNEAWQVTYQTLLSTAEAWAALDPRRTQEHLLQDRLLGKVQRLQDARLALQQDTLPLRLIARDIQRLRRSLGEPAGTTAIPCLPAIFAEPASQPVWTLRFIVESGHEAYLPDTLQVTTHLSVAQGSNAALEASVRWTGPTPPWVVRVADWCGAALANKDLDGRVRAPNSAASNWYNVGGFQGSTTLLSRGGHTFRFACPRLNTDGEIADHVLVSWLQYPVRLPAMFEIAVPIPAHT